MSMTPEAKKKLSKTIRGLREHLLESLHDATEAEYRLAVRTQDAGLSESAQVRRKRLEGWISEQVRAQEGMKGKARREGEDFRIEAEKQAAYTLLNRLVILRLMEASVPEGNGNVAPLREPAVVAGGWESPGYRQFREVAPALVRRDETEGYAHLLDLVFRDLAEDLPGIFGSVGVADLIPVRPGTLRHIVDSLNDPELESCWMDDMTLGWIYQYWNDPERDALDAKLSARKKLEPHEIASKTQLFTERYLVDWLLQNSLGPMWLGICRKHGWTPEAKADGTIERLEERRKEWRAMREKGGVSLNELMPLHTEAERRWAYYVSQAIPDDAVEKAPETVRDLRILDPAVGSGHFLVVAMDLLFALYQEEAKHRGEEDQPEWDGPAIVDRILSHNLHGIDLDPRAIQIAAAALWMKARRIAPGVQPSQMNLVTSDLRLASLPDDDPGLVELRAAVEREAGIPAKLTDTVIEALRGAQHLGSLLRIDNAVDEAIAKQEEALAVQFDDYQKDIFGEKAIQQARIDFDGAAAKRSVLDQLESFLTRHTSADDLGLRMRGEQLAAGVRFVRVLREATFDLIVANPPYQDTTRLQAASYIQRNYPRGKANLYAAFLERGLQLVRPGGVSAMLTMRDWMFLTRYATKEKKSRREIGLRESLLTHTQLSSLGDFGAGAFEEIQGARVSVAAAIFRKIPPCHHRIPALRLTGSDTESRGASSAARKRAAALVQSNRYDFAPSTFREVPQWPLVYWWGDEELDLYRQNPTIGEVAPVRQGMASSDNARFLRRPWEVLSPRFRPYVKGGAGRMWYEPLSDVIDWEPHGLAVKVFAGHKYGSYTRTIKNEAYYFRPCVAFSKIGSRFAARVVRYPSVIDVAGSSVFHERPREVACLLNSERVREIVSALNPTVNFQVGDVNRVPLLSFPQANEVFSSVLEPAFETHEATRETSSEFRRPGPSPWAHAQRWAQDAVDNEGNTQFPDYSETFHLESATDHLSFALGVALGRFGAGDEGILNPSDSDLSACLPVGILWLDTTLSGTDQRDGLGHPATDLLHAGWQKHGPTVAPGRRGLREWLALDFFKDVHKGMYENRPIHWPLSSANRTFVAWVTIHRFTDRTLRVLLADHLHPTLNRIEGELDDLRGARNSAEARAAKQAESRFAELSKARDELKEFINAVAECADKGPPPVDSKCPPREQDARYAPDLDDGVMINSAALWPLLEPQWKEPKKWWKELSQAKGRKDYDWSKIAMRYWPTRVDKKCQEDPSLAVAHGCFWRYHPERAWAWELRLQDEIGPTFRIEERPYGPGGRDLGDLGHDVHRSNWIANSPVEALAAVEAEAARRMGRGADKQIVPEMEILEEGLWRVIPEQVWEMELKLSGKQDYEFHLRAPDEAEARREYEEAHPEKVQERKEFLESLEPPRDLLEQLDAHQEVGG